MSAGATIQRYTVSNGIKGHVEYIVKVDYQGKVWPVRKRYSEFDIFDKKIRKFGYNLPISLPPKLLWGNLNEEVINARVRELDVYLSSLMSNVPSDNSLLKEFLEVDANMLALEIQSAPTIAHFNKADRIRELVRIAETSFIHADAHWRLVNCGDGTTTRRRAFKPHKPKARKQRKHKPSFASSVGSHDSRKISTTSSSNMDATDANIIRRIIRDKYLSQANNAWPTSDSAASVPPPAPPSDFTLTSDEEIPSMEKLPLDAVPTTTGRTSIYEDAERVSNDLFIEQRHVISMLTLPVSSVSLRRVEDIAQVIDRVGKTECAVKVSIADLVGDIHPSIMHCSDQEVEAALATVRSNRRLNPLSSTGTPIERSTPSSTPLRLRHTAEDSGVNDMPSNAATSSRRIG